MHRTHIASSPDAAGAGWARKRRGVARRGPAAIIAAFLVWGTAHALEPARTSNGVPYLSGGVGLEERAAMREQAGAYSLRLMTAVQGSGEYVDGAEAVVTDLHGRELSRVRLDGPWLYLDLAPGAYRVAVQFNGQTLQQRVQVHRGRAVELVFRFRGR
jgi:hypothetical protein